MSNFFDEILGQTDNADRITVKSVPTVDPVDIISNTTREDINEDIEQAVLGYNPLDALLEEPVRREATGEGDGLTIQTVESYNTVNTLELEEIKTRRRTLTNLEFSNTVRPQIDDPLRYMLGKYWVLRPSGKPKVFHEDMSFSNIKKVPFTAKIKNVKYDYSQEYPEEVSVIQLYPDQNQIQSTDSRFWTNLIEGGGSYDPVVEFQDPKTDHYIQDEKPFSQRELDLISGAVNTKFANVEVFYNFYIDRFEEVAAEVDERITPKVYGFEAIIEDGNEESLGDQMARRLNTLNGALSDKFFVDGDTDIGQYFDEWAIAVSSDDYGYLSEEQGFFSLSVKDMEQFVNERIERRAQQFPYYIKLSFSAESRTQLSEILEQAGLTKDLFRYLMNSQYDIQNQGFSTIAPALPFAEYSSATTIKNLDSVVIQNTSLNLDRRVWDISNWLQNVGVFQTDLEPEEASLPEFLVSNFEREGATSDIIKTLPESSNFDLLDLIKGYTYEIQTDDPEESSVFSKYIAQGKIRKLIRKELRGIEEIFKGEPAYSEVIGFRIAKHLVDQDGLLSPEPIQNIYIPNSNGFNVANYIDTQIRYDGTYKYIVYALNFVIGNQYEYERASQQSQLKFSFDQNSPYGFVVRNKPSIKVFETEYYSTDTVRLIDRPPMPPEFEFQEYKDINDRVIINLSRNLGEAELPYISINVQDEANLELLRQSQPGRESVFMFASDDDIKEFEVFRTTEPPSSYRDFAGTNRLFSTQSPNQEFFSRDYQSLTVIDNIVPNRKYYYTFRNRDVHGFYSNPSEVFEIEMVNNSGTSYLIARPYEFPEDLPSIRRKSFRKFIRISPSMIQMAINTFKTDLEKFTSAQEIKNITLGQAKEKLWNKSIKMRITSKKTGRKLDINFSYEHLVRTLLFLDKGISEVTPIENIVNTDSFSAALQLLLVEQNTDLI